LRGGGGKPNYSAAHVASSVSALGKAKVNTRLMVDCSHANSEKDPSRQPLVAADLAAQIEAGDRNIMGVMIESFIVAGNQALRARADLCYGQSITDGCLSWVDTVPVLERLAQAKRNARG
jgi:3-deoxy-7-phosphoheptulonate synthase